MVAQEILIENLSKVFDQTKALENFSVRIPSGKMIALAGPDGSGKTTLIRLLAGLLLPTKGKISVFGYDTSIDAEKISDFIGYMPQKFGVYEDLTVIQNLNLYADLQGLEKEKKEGTFKKLLDFTSLSNFTDRLSGALSGGMKQKLGLACALLSRPKLLLLDEPTVGVDPISRRELWSMVQELKSDGITVIWSTAYLDEAQKCELALLLRDGSLLFFGPPSQLMERVAGRVFYAESSTSAPRKILTPLLEKEQVLDGVIEGDKIRLILKKDGNIENLGVVVDQAEPRFEDAFMDILGGGPGGRSILAEKSPPITSEHEQMIVAKNITKKFGSFTAVDHVEFSVKKGEIFGLLGPNGAGKSTTFKMLCGLLQPTSGETIVNGLNLAKAKGSARAKIGYMAQKFSLYDGLSVFQNLEIFSGFYGLYGKYQKEIIDEMIDVFDFNQVLDLSVAQVPLGYKQRLALACAVMHHPQILFLDEPTSGVDPIMRREFWNHINGLVDKGTTIILTTHFMDEAENCDRIALIYKGKKITEGTPAELKSRAKSETLLHPTLEDAFISLVQSSGL